MPLSPALTPSGSCDNPNNLPLDVALAIEESTARQPAAQCEDAPDTVDNLTARLTAIRERLFWLAACWATTLSPDIAREADNYRELFRTIADDLRKRDPEAVERLIVGHEALILSEPSPKPTLPLAIQQLFELRGEIQSTPSQPPRPKPQYPDGLSSFV